MCALSNGVISNDKPGFQFQNGAFVKLHLHDLQCGVQSLGNS